MAGTNLTEEEETKYKLLEEEFCKAFEMFDKNSDGYITVEELRDAMKSMGEKISFEEAEEEIRKADKDGDNRMNYKEFVKSMLAK